jgi:AcrR family transcriptional regulator
MKTKDRIIQAAVELFNAQGEQNVTTNHIAAHLSMSPGNLYYHFRNKEDIIRAIFLFAGFLNSIVSVCK